MMLKQLLFFLLFLSFSLTPSFSGVQSNEFIEFSETINEVVYITKTGKKYNKSSCHHLKKSKIQTTKTKAKNSGYTACKVCKP